MRQRQSRVIGLHRQGKLQAHTRFTVGLVEAASHWVHYIKPDHRHLG